MNRIVIFLSIFYALASMTLLLSPVILLFFLDHRVLCLIIPVYILLHAMIPTYEYVSLSAARDDMIVGVYLTIRHDAFLSI